MAKKKTEDIDMDQVIADMRDATMDKLDKMIHPDIISEEDADKLAMIFYRLYAAFVKIGFTKTQAMNLLKHMMTIGIKEVH